MYINKQYNNVDLIGGNYEHSKSEQASLTFMQE